MGNPISRRENLVVQEMDGEVLIYDLRVNKAFCLNETSALVWQACNGQRSLPEINEFVGQTLNKTTSEGLIWLALEKLKEAKLIEGNDLLPDSLKGISRRQAVKKIGLGTVAALPIVSSIAAPSALHAQSGLLPRGVSCSVSSDCDPSNTTTLLTRDGMGGGLPPTLGSPTGACCRADTGMGNYGAYRTCVPGPSTGFSVPAAWDPGANSGAGANVGSGTVSCISG